MRVTPTPGTGPLFPSLDSIEAALWPAFALIVFVAAAVLVDLMIILAARFRLVDLPNRRSAHSLPTARGGGVAIVLVASLASLVVALRWPSVAGRTLVGIVLPSLAIAGVGMVDDVRPLRATLRLAIQVGVACWMTFVLGPLTSIVLPGGGTIEFGWLGWPVTIVWIVGMINAYNFMDGSDGMAALGAVVVGCAMAAIGLDSSALAVMLLAALVAAASAGFLVFNWQPARVFMGDVGSGFLGLVFAGLPLLFDAGTREAAFVPSILCLWPYVYDPFVSVLRRLWHGHNPMHPHREFLFHRLIRSGVSHSSTAIIYALLSLLGGVLGLAAIDPAVPPTVAAWIPWVVVALAVMLTVGVEWRCSRVGLAPPSTSPTPASH
jgi:UDP-N-acetylmuramyl pentapeptide phosphotransferase/UDP-N-acetylglucosamine-1-phosphate transferase